MLIACKFKRCHKMSTGAQVHLKLLTSDPQELFELCPEDLHQLYMKMHEDVPEAMDYQLRRRAILNGDE